MPTGRPLALASISRGRAVRSGSSASATIVGYGADPEWAIDTVMGLVDDGAIAVHGNHDTPIGTPSETMNAEAQAAIEWTRGRLERGAAALSGRTAADAARRRSALRSFRSLASRAMALCARHARCRAQHRGRPSPCHLLRPHPPAGALFDVVDGEDDELRSDIRRAGAIAGGRRWLAVLGSVGQPRDGDPAASFAMFDTEIARDHLLPRALRCRGGGGADPRQRPAALAGRSPARGEVRQWPSLRSSPARDRRLHDRRARPSGRHGDAVDA